MSCFDENLIVCVYAPQNVYVIEDDKCLSLILLLKYLFQKTQVLWYPIANMTLGETKIQKYII